MIEAIIFDMDGVLVDSEEIHHRTEINMLKGLGVDLSPEEHSQFVGRTDSYMWSALKKRYDLKESVERLIYLARERFVDNISGNARSISGAVDLVKGLHGRLKLAVASSSCMDQVRMIIEEIGIKPYFETLVSGECITNSKPAPDIFLEAAKRLGVDPKNCVVIEDAVNGIAAARSAGMKCIGLTTSFSREKLSYAHLVVDNLNELNYDRIRELNKE